MRRFRKNLFSGELEEVDDDPAVEFAAQNARVRERTAWMVTKRRRFASPWDTGKDVINRNMSLKPEDATPERIAAENEAARRHNTGAWYDSKGECHIATRGTLNREMKRKRYSNFDAGYGDHCTL